MKIPGPAARWVQHAALAVLMVSVGVLIGARGTNDAPSPDPAAGVDTVATAAAAGPVAAVAPSEPAPPQLQIPPAPGFESVLAAGGGVDTAANFAGSYAILRGASTVDRGAERLVESAPPSGTSASEPAGAGVAPAVAPAATGAAEPDRGTQERRDSGPAVPESTRFRPSPAQGLPRGIALRHPMFAIIRPGGRAVMYDLGMGGGPTPSGLEGEWAVIGDCARRVRVEFATRARRVGEMQGVGRVEGNPGWSGEPVVATQACAAASDLLVRPRSPSPAERGRVELLVRDAGFAGSDLQEIAGSHGFEVLVFRQDGRRRSLIVVAGRNGGAPAVTKEIDGGVRLVGVYRSGSGATAWFAVGDRQSPEALVVASSGDLRSWHVPGPTPLQVR